MSHKRQNPRYPKRQQVLLRVADRNELRSLWMRDISKGGLYLEADPTPQLRSQIVVVLRTPDGTIALEAEVVHVATGPTREPMGVGVQFTGLDGDKRHAIENYVEGLAAELNLPGEDTADAVDERRLKQLVQQFLGGFEREALYEALGAEPEEGTHDLVRRIDGLIENFNTQEASIAPGLKTRCAHALTLAQRVRRMMVNTASRRDYDLRHEHTELHLRRAEVDPSLRSGLRERWRELHPNKLSQATTHGKAAIEALSHLQLEKAIAEAQAALVLDPFNFELRDAARDWERRMDMRSTSPAGMPALGQVDGPDDDGNAPT